MINDDHHHYHDDDDADNNDSNDGGGGVKPSCLLNCCSGTSNLPSKSTQSLRMTRQSQPNPGYKNNIRKGWVGKRQKSYEKLSQLEVAHMNSQLREQDMALWRGGGGLRR